MNKTEFYRYVKDRDAKIFLNNLELELERFKIGGAGIHTRDNLRTIIISCFIWHYDDGTFPLNETMSELKQRVPEDYNYVSDKILKMVNQYGFLI